ncbi:hypothetical protein EDWATA_02135 [Edwardsiella tarda ATCC 23685]|uniref:Uncharacterized protein n=1 Tax=Edwardsiella tarda ATCC 23685 TaxID=500638 RepID=D4F5V7_EDWTA|nr:hypothetical protein EDWATA_02135 [Edwardsiella tarda ATCC 23685]
MTIANVNPTINIAYAIYKVYILHMPFRSRHAQTQDPTPHL